MHVLRHHHVADYRKPIAAANLLQNFEKQIPILLFPQQRTSLITACGDEMQISSRRNNDAAAWALEILIMEPEVFDVTNEQWGESTNAHPSKIATGGAAVGSYDVKEIKISRVSQPAFTGF